MNINEKKLKLFSFNLEAIKVFMSRVMRNPSLTLCLPVSSADNLGKQFAPRSGPTIRRA